MPRQHIIKQSTHRYLEINDPEKAVGLWSHFESRQTTLKPVGETTKALGRFLNEDIARHDCWDEMKKALLSKNVEGEKRKTEARKLAEYEEEFRQKGGLPPKWLILWRRFGSRLEYKYEFVDKPKDVQMFFGHPSVGIGFQEPTHHSSRVLFLRKAIPNQLPTTNQPTTNYRYFVAVVLKPGGTKWWWSIDKTGVTWTDNTIDRLVISPNSQLEWSPIDAGVITERMADRDICLFEMEDDPLFRAITDSKVNPSEKFAHLSYDCEFYVHDPQGPHERYYITWSVVYNEGRKNYDAHDRNHLRSVEVLLERKKDWAKRCFDMTKVEEAEKAAHWVVENNGCIALPHDPPTELRYAAMHALYYITFPNRPPDAIGGLLRGYQLPGRMLEHFPMAVHNYGIKNMVAAMKKKSEDAAVRKRKIIVNALFERTCRVILSRNAGAKIDNSALRLRLSTSTTLTADTVGDILESVGAREILESAAWKWGFMEGNALQTFKTGPTAGALKLPDLSLALCFEHRLGLTGAAGSVGALVQTAPIRSLESSTKANPRTKEVFVKARRMWTPAPGTLRHPIEYAAETIRILRDENRYYFFAYPKFAMTFVARDFLYSTHHSSTSTSQFDSPTPFPIKAYRLDPIENAATRTDRKVTEEIYDWNKVVTKANLGRCYLYSLDFGEDTWLADAVFTPENIAPCRIIATQPLFGTAGMTEKPPQADKKQGNYVTASIAPREEEASAYVLFTFNPAGKREGRKVEGRSWRSYCDAIPEDAQREIIRWPVVLNADASHTQNMASSNVATTAPAGPTPRFDNAKLCNESPDQPTGSPVGDATLAKTDRVDPRIRGGVDTSVFAKSAYRDSDLRSKSLTDACRKVVETDGILLTDANHLALALEAMSYIITNDDPYAMGGLYYGYMIRDRVFKDTDGRVEWRATQERSEKEENVKRREWDKKRFLERKGKPLVEIVQPETARQLEKLWREMIEAETLTDKKTSKFFTLEAPIVIGDEFKEMVAREFRRVVATGTMSYQRQLVRPSHEVALGIWLARLEPKSETTNYTNYTNCEAAPIRVIREIRGSKEPTTNQPTNQLPTNTLSRLKELDELLAMGLVTEAEHAAKRMEILGS